MCGAQRLSIAYLTVNDPTDRRSWSGTHFYIAQALQKHCGDVTPLGPINPISTYPRKVAQRFLRAVSHTEYLYTHTTGFALETTRIARRRLQEAKFDVIVAPAGSAQIAHLDTDIPVVYLSDSTVKTIFGYYPEFSNVPDWIIEEANLIEQLAIDKSRVIIYSSDWAAGSALKDYRANPSKVHVVPFGANLDDPPEKETILDKPDSPVCRLLFVGVDWAKKGGEIALETFLALEQMGIRAELSIVGCRPPKELHNPKVRVYEFLSKNDSGQRKRLRGLYSNADFFILPTRADCSPIVLCEAAAFGLPSICTDTGGVPGIVRDGYNGKLLPLEARGADYAVAIASIFNDKAAFRALRLRSREDYETRLNWDAWGQKVSALLPRLKLRSAFAAAGR